MKTKYILISFLTLVLLGIAGSSYAGYDASHNDSNSIACSDCHQGNFPADSICTECHMNDTGGGYSKMSAPKVLGHTSATTSTKYGTWSTMCKDCHYPHDQARVIYGSQTYLVTGNIASVTNNGNGTTTFGYNNLIVYKPEWANSAFWGDKSGPERGLILILDPDNPYSGRGGEIRDATASTITLTGAPPTLTDPALVGLKFALVYGQYVGTSPTKTIRTPSGVVKPAKFFNNTGPNSFAYSETGAPTDPVVDGVCQVCHTMTSAWKSDGSLAAVGVHAGLNGADCMQCHKHEAGFKASGCDTCHGNPPINNTPGGPAGLVLLSNGSTTGSTTAGAHDRHVNSSGIACDSCHFNSVGAGSTHNDGTVQAVTLGFNFFNGVVQGGSYNGQTAVDYNTTTTTPPTTVTKTGLKQCGNIYCHSSGQSSTGGTPPTYATPIWDSTAGMTCGSCHQNMDTSATATGNHTKHSQGAINYSCATCHSGYTETTATPATHVNNLINLGFSGTGAGTTYSQGLSSPVGNNYGACSTSYCHSSGQSSTGGATPTYAPQTWGGAALNCGSCHQNMDTSATATGSHLQHAQGTFNYSCATCHAGNTETTYNTATHVDQQINLGFSVTNTYSQGLSSPAGNNYGSCTTSDCHGSNSGIWGANTTNHTCTKCHGNPTAPATYTLYKAAPGADATGVDTNGNSAATDPQVGAHDTHLRSLNNYSSDIACNQCHTVPASATDAGHLGPLPADLTWGTLATLNGATPLYASGTCLTTYCHGAKMPRGTTAGTDTSPAWTDVNYLTGVASNDCGKCHGYPPVAIAAHLSNNLPVPPTTCINCHDHVNAPGTGFTDITKHINGTVEGGGDNCTDCHTNTSLTAGHLNHTNPNTVLSGKKLSAGDYGNPTWWYSYSTTGGVPLAACGYCHPNTQSTHLNNVKNLNFDPNEPGLPAGTLKGKNGSPPVFTQNPGVSVTCSSVYCHSDGYSPSGGGPTARDYGYKPSPDWFGGAYIAGACNGCHGNSPTGSSAHGKHAVGIHYKTIYNLQTGGLATAGNTPTGSHGNAATSTSINCNLCHNSTVTVSYNAQNAVCLNCHTDTNTPATGNESISINGSSTVHVNGVPDVNFAAVQIRSKAQVRDDITAVPELTENWTRVNGYKGAVSGSHDMSVSALNTTGYTGGNCTVSCHNGFPIQWTSTVTCTSCHTALPQ